MINMIEKLPVQLIAVDLDGTLLNRNGEISIVNADAILYAHCKGIKVAICTGRSPEIAGLMALDAGLACPILGINGAIMAEKPLGAHFIRHFMDKETAYGVFGILEKNPFDYCLFGEEELVMRKDGSSHFTAIPFGDRLAKETKLVTSSGLSSISALLTRDVCKFVVWDNKDAGIASMRAEIEKTMRVEMMQSWSNNMEIMPLGVNKGTAIVEYASYWHIPLGAVMAIGDQENDLPMLRNAGYSVAMGNATALVKASAGYVTDTCDRDGVAKAIYTIALPTIE
jgi:Cof subfamily protein (haloacid dehalogenase superfamily)